jgi:hypothetical protein
MRNQELEERTMTISVSVVFSAFIIICTVVIFALICLNHNQIEKRKNLAPGKVLVRRCETILIKYENNELQKLTTNSKSLSTSETL